jgi:hypothetical protein
MPIINPLPEGKVQIFFGYLLDDALVVTQQPIDIVTENMPEPIQTDTELEITEADVPIDPSPMLLPEDDRLVGQLAYRWTNGATLIMPRFLSVQSPDPLYLRFLAQWMGKP